MKTILEYNDKGQLIGIAGICKARDFRPNTPRREPSRTPTVKEDSNTSARRGDFFYNVDEVF